MRNGRTVQEALDDPDYLWNPFERMKTPDVKAKNAEQIIKLSDNLQITPERFVAEHRNILIWSYGDEEYDDPRLKTWAERVLEILRSPELCEAAYRQRLAGDTLVEALRSLEKSKRRAERDRLREERDARFTALHLDD